MVYYVCSVPASTTSVLDGPFEKVLPLFTEALDLAGLEGFRGCAFINLAVETAAPERRLHGLAQADKAWMRANLVSQLRSDTFANSASLADQILVL